MTVPNRLRILCLHGYTQNAKIFKGRTAVIAKDLKETAEFVYVSAPHRLPDKEDMSEAEKLKRDPNDEGPRAWYKVENDQQVYIGYDESMEFLQNPLPTHDVLTPERRVSLPSIHIIGRQDAWVVPERSEALLTCFEELDRETYYHEGGHFLPTNAENRRKYKEWIGQFIKKGEEVDEA
ncbi:hypothetical protein HDV00_003221 [Rhizophlyctis rosea]|nr:hypothetical protein HDV00_003221 [Rhizophlyctis rosea]